LSKSVKRSLAHKITLRILILLVVTMLILFIGTYFIISALVKRETTQYATTLIDIYSDMLYQYSYEKCKAISTENAPELMRVNDFFCNRYNVDYVYIYTIDEEAGTCQYILVSFSENTEDQNPGDHMIGRVVKCEFKPSELDVWNGRKERAFLETDNYYGHDVSTLRLVLDTYGNYVIAGIDINYETIYYDAIKILFIVSGTVAFILTDLGFLLFFIIKRRVTVPAKKIAVRMQSFITDNEYNAERLDESGNDEFAVIASAFNNMTDNIGEYIENIKKLTIANTNKQKDVDVSSRIQRGLLPKDFADFGYCKINAMMRPAKDIGGDLYDYIDLNDGHIYIVIADVSGKGLPAAFFMSISLMLIRQFAKMSLPPNEILRRTNNALSEINRLTLFTTAFIGLYDCNNQSFSYSNAGHNSPYVVGEEIKELTGARGTVLGLFEGEQYALETISLKPGERVLLFTDGVIETVNEEKEFYGEQRLYKLLNTDKARNVNNIVDYIFNDIRDFSGEAEQYDDITMIALSTNSSERLDSELTLDYDIKEFEKIKHELFRLPISRDGQMNLCLAVEEAFANICLNAFNGAAPEGEKIIFRLSYSDEIRMQLIDGGMQFNPLESINAPDNSDDADLTIGGLGIFLYTSLCDHAEYEYKDGKNILTLIKKGGLS